MDDLSIIRVSVLDLDNSVRFSRDIRNAARKHRVTNLPPKWNQTEISTLLGRIKQCCYCISLNDVNVAGWRRRSSDWTAKHSTVLGDLIGIWWSLGGSNS